MRLGTNEETPAKHFHFKIRANWLLTSIDKDQLSIFGETPGDYSVDCHSENLLLLAANSPDPDIS
jgi:hypothetical protein